MANFRLYPGIYLEICEDVPPTRGIIVLKKGKIYQLLHTGTFAWSGVGYVTFVGINSDYAPADIRGKVKPVL